MDKRVSDIYISLTLTWMLPHTFLLSIQNPALKCQQTEAGKAPALSLFCFVQIILKG